MAKYKVRESFFVQLDENKRINENEPVDLTDAQAQLHAHRLEGVDASGVAYLDSLSVKVTPPGGVDVGALVAAEVAKALGSRAAK